MSDHEVNHIRKFQRSLYDKAYREARSALVGDSKTIASYTSEFEAELPEGFKSVPEQSVLNELGRHDVILYGDFHTLKQSQKGLLHLLRAYGEHQPNCRFVLAIEAFRHCDQALIDSYQAGGISEQVFLRETRYSETWGFPWQHFKPLLDYARFHDFPVVGINTESAGRDPILLRDQFAASVIKDTMERFKGHKVVCIVGEYHLTENKIPLAIRRRLKTKTYSPKILRILNNIDRYYFQDSFLSGKRPLANFLQLKPDLFCLMNCPPWIKWHSYCLWEELRANEIIDDTESDFDDGSLYTEDHLDLDYHFLEMVKSIIRFIDVRLDNLQLLDFHIDYSPDAEFSLDRFAGITDDQISKMFARVNLDGSYYVGFLNLVWLTKLTTTCIAEAASQFLYAKTSGFTEKSQDPAEVFYANVLKSAAGMVGAKILNPRKKITELTTFESFLNNQRLHRLSGHAQVRKEAAQAVVKFFAEGITGHAENSALHDIVKQDLSTHCEVSTAIGKILGGSFYQEVAMTPSAGKKIRDFYCAKTLKPNDVKARVLELFNFASHTYQASG